MLTPIFNSLSPWYLLLCILAGLIYSAFLYARTSKFTLPVRIILAGLRAIVICLLLILLFDPLFKKSDLFLEKPILVIAQDHSASINFGRNTNAASLYEKSMRQLEKKLGEQYAVKTYSFGSTLRNGLDFHYTDKATDFNSLFEELSRKYENQNLGAVIIASDGIYNRGLSPVYSIKNFQAPVYTIALGDSVQAKDLVIDNIDYNNLVYEGDKFQIQVNIEAHQLKGKSCRLTIRSEGKILHSSLVAITSQHFISQVPLFLEAGKPGFRKITVSLEPLAGEVTLKNNEKTIIVEVIKGKLKILLVSAAPQPDLSALRQALQTFRNDDIVLKIAAEARLIDTKGYDLVILYQLPALGSGTAAGWSKLTEGAVPVWFIIGEQTDLNRFNSLQKDVFVTPGAFLSTELLAETMPAFNAFILSDSLKSAITQFPPLAGPAPYQVSSAAGTVLRQPAHDAIKTQPLLFTTEQGTHKAGYLMGSGLWRWRLADFERNNNHHATDELLGKFVQYLTSKEDKRRFRVSMPQRILNEDEAIVFDGFLFNKSYEPVNSADVTLDAVNSAGKVYRFTFTKTANAYRLETGSLAAGDYGYTARVTGEPTLQVSGKFAIKALALEDLTTTANHNLLYQLASKTGGAMVYPAAIGSLPGLIQQNDLIKMQSHEVRSVKEFISIRLIAFLLLFLLLAEWGLRKWNGVY